MSTTIDELKSRALLILGVLDYKAGAQTPPCKAVDALYLPTLREFLSEFQWTWATEKSMDAPVNPLVLYQLGSEDDPYIFVPSSFEVVPNVQPKAQQAFCYLLAARCATPGVARADMLPLLEQQYRKALSDARYPDAWQRCRRGEGALSADSEEGGL